MELLPSLLCRDESAAFAFCCCSPSYSEDDSKGVEKEPINNFVPRKNYEEKRSTKETTKLHKEDKKSVLINHFTHSYNIKMQQASSSSLSSCTSVVRIGGPTGSEVAIGIIQKQLLHHFQHSSGNDDERCPLIQFNNKYFDAFVRLKSILDDKKKENDDDCDDPINEKEDGVILIFPSDNASIDTFTEIHNQMETNIHDLGDTLRLCLTTTTINNNSTTTTMTKKEEEELYSQRVLWCLDHGYEYIDVDLSQEGLTSGFDNREKDGFARVVEAMRGTVWSSAIMKSRSSKCATTSTSSITDVNNNITRSDPNKCMSMCSEQKTMTKDDNCEHQNVNNNIGNQESETTKDKIYSINTNTQEEETRKDDEDDAKREKILDDIEQVMKEASRIRKESRNGEMTDDERKKRAGDAASMLLGLLDQIGFGDDNEEEDSDDNDNLNEE